MPCSGRVSRAAGLGAGLRSRRPLLHGDEALRVLDSAEIDLILLDYDLDGETGARFLVRAMQRGFQGRVLVVTAGLSDVEVADILRLGVTGIFLKHNPPGLLAKAIRKVIEGEVWLDQRYLKVLLKESRTAVEDSSGRKLGGRELEVLRSLLKGLANKKCCRLCGSRKVR